MPARRSALPCLGALLATACVSATPPAPQAETDPLAAERLEAAAARANTTYPDLSAIPEPGARPSARDLEAEASTLEAEAAALRALREEARTPLDASALTTAAAALRADLAAARAAIEAAPPVEVPNDLRR